MEAEGSDLRSEPLSVDAAATNAATPISTASPTVTPISTATTAASTSIPIVDATPTPAASTAAPLYPASVLLEEKGYHEDSNHIENDTTAEAMLSTNQTVKVTFYLADPPAVSHFRVHSPEHAEFRLMPRVVFSEKHLVLFRFAFTLRPRSTVGQVPPPQYFVYKAAAHGQPSLTPIPTSRRPDNSFGSCPSVWPSPDQDGDDFLVADLAITPTRGHYVLHTFSSKKKEWTAKPLQLQATTQDLPGLPHKVITLGEGTVGWVDLWRGIIVCNVFDRDPLLRFVPLPKPEFNLRGIGGPQLIRDVTYYNGFIKFIEMEHYPRYGSSNIKRNFKTTKDLDTAYVLHDSELFIHNLNDLLEKPSPLPSTWKIRTCYRHTSWKHWCKEHTVHVDDILANDPSYYMMLPELWDDSARKFTLSNLETICPILSIHGGNVVYLVSKLEAYGEKKWVVGVDLQKKTVEMLEPFNAGGSCLPFLACTFSDYLNTTPRSCAPEVGCSQNYPLNGYLRPGNIIQNNPNMQIVGGYSRNSIEHDNLVHAVNGYQFQPQVVVPPRSFPQTLQHNFTQSGSGYAGPMSAQSTYAVLNTDGHAQPLLSIPMNNRFQTQILREPVSPAVPVNTQMAWVPMDARFLSWMPLVPAYPSAAFDRSMHVWMREHTSVPFNEP